MDPMMMAMLAMNAISAMNPGGSDSKMNSTYNKQQRGGIDDILKMLTGMKGQGDITQNDAYGHGMDWLNSLFNDSDFFNKFEAPLQRQFQEQTVPDLANRFASMGSGGALGSTGFRNQLAREGSNLGTNLGALRGQLQQQGANQSLQYAQQPFQNMLGLYNTALGHPTENIYQPASNPTAPLAGAFTQGYFQNQGTNRGFPGQSQLTL